MKWPIGFNSPRNTQSKDLETAYEKHRERLRTIKANVDNRPPIVQNHLLNNAKSVKTLKASQDRIYRENMVLLKRMNDQFSRKTPSFTAPPYQMNRNTFSEHRMRLKKLVEKDNQFILKKLNDNAKDSHYSRERMIKDEEKRKQVLQIMCHYRGVPSSIQSHNASHRKTGYVLSKKPVAPKEDKENQKNNASRPKTAGPYRDVKTGAFKSKKYETPSSGTSKYYHGETQTLVAVKSPYAANYKTSNKTALFA